MEAGGKHLGPRNIWVGKKNELQLKCQGRHLVRMEDAETACQGMAKSIWFGKKWEKAKYVRMTFADRSICY